MCAPCKELFSYILFFIFLRRFVVPIDVWGCGSSGDLPGDGSRELSDVCPVVCEPKLLFTLLCDS
ncbi:MAG: hypothetical protein ACI8Z5_002472 [Lentimonas sp.]|jgi:hypothetical protein